jgi:glyoxylase-like metal-dependent hydrolase (beta-lactamase superfamily II)
MSNKLDAKMCREIAPGVYYKEIGKGFSRSNVYFVKSGETWVLIDAASIKCGRLIRETAASLFGGKAQPTSILLTHNHPDHGGSVLELLRSWDCPVYLHPDELPYSAITDLATVEKFANPLDRRVVLPILRMMPRKKAEATLTKSSLKDVVRGFDPAAAVPGLPDWECIPTPGHTPGHVAFFRPADRVLITGDAIVTVDINSPAGMLSWGLRMKKQRVSPPPWYSTFNKPQAIKSLVTLVNLKPWVLASGHGVPMTGDSVAAGLHKLAEKIAGTSSA